MAGPLPRSPGNRKKKGCGILSEDTAREIFLQRPSRNGNGTFKPSAELSHRCIGLSRSLALCLESEHVLCSCCALAMGCLPLTHQMDQALGSVWRGREIGARDLESQGTKCAFCLRTRCSMPDTDRVHAVMGERHKTVVDGR